MVSGGAVALGAAIVVAVLVGAFVVLPAMGIDPLGVGAVFNPDGETTPDASQDQDGGDTDPGPGDSDLPGGNDTIPGPSKGFEWPVLWSTLSASAPDLTGATAATETTSSQVEITTLNLTELVVTLKWTEETPPDGYERTASDTFSLQVEAPDGTVYDGGSGSEGNVTLRIPLAALPTEPSKLTGDNERVALNKLRSLAPANETAKGRWILRVTCNEAGAYALTTPLGPVEPPADQGEKDTGNAWTLSVAYTSYAAKLGEPKALGGSAPSGGTDHSQHMSG